jgi:uncharacterized LabA/DUF88 family protein
MASSMSDVSQTQVTTPSAVRVVGLVDGFNLYHALDWYDNGTTLAEKTQYRKYKWVCLKSLVSRFVDAPKERLEFVEYFTSYPTWDPAKEVRHKKFVMAQISQGIHPPIFGEFKNQSVLCKNCKTEFIAHTEKQTDVNIAVRMVALAHENKFDKLILVTADSDQVPALKLIRTLHPEKTLASLVPIGRGSNEIYKVCHINYQMTEQHLKDCQLPDIVEWKSQGIRIARPAHYR